ncbi:SDR family NAD(P)-dependent oxidoreductase [Seongchinamella sediminis]|uniref:SDR family NAD(P)-dependent oxidoreductase n=1 Tax=Seongchinamella sediminis TaxID=2283635 RepID=A0A3L7E004_9GAMM|nr:SDR family NAD(P)-dependent oxidoreductase [Seongchinamella sediminis]RLQ23177.1 SDR family NAD(P)-dependent oxidoreductase [Seongchinamella sediminis]
MLANNRIVITGAAGTLGQAAAKVAKEKGAEVIGLDVVAADSLDHVDSYHQVDLLDRAATTSCFTRLGDFDALLNIAGGFSMGMDAAEPSDEQWDWMFRINVTTLRNAVMAAVPVFRDRGRGKIVNIGALGALSGAAGLSAYCCAKSSVMRLTESLSEELKGQGINVNAVLPSIIDTPPNRESMPDADFASWVSAEKLAQVLCFLASEDASAIHGALLPVKGLV